MKVQTPQERLVKNIALGHCEIDPEYRMQDERQHQQYNSVSSDAGSEVVWVREWFERSRFLSYFLQPFPLSLVATLLVDPFVITKARFLAATVTHPCINVQPAEAYGREIEHVYLHLTLA